jgi:hypothetical protein
LSCSSLEKDSTAFRIRRNNKTLLSLFFMKSFKVITGFLFLTAMFNAALAVTVSLAPSKDNTLYEDSTGQLSNGQGIYLYAGKIGNDPLRRGLIAFDLTSIPANATVTMANVSMFLSRNGPAGPGSVSLSKMSRDWGEGASNAGTPGGTGTQAETGDATWLHNFYATSFWVTPGGDFSPTLSATTPIGVPNATYMWSGSGLIADVQSWISNPANNFGWVILGDEINSGSAVRFSTRENSSNRPQLTVTYQLPVTPTPTPGATSTPTPTPGGTSTPTPTPGGTSTPTPTPGGTSTPTPTPGGTSTPTPTPGTTSTPTPSATPALTATPTPTPRPVQALNISTRMQVDSGNNVLIGGFIITGTAPKSVAIRGIGPSLSAFVSGALTDPTLELRASHGALIFQNDNWQDNSAQAAQLSAVGLGLQDPKESGIVAALPPAGYTAVLAGKNGGTGIGLVEIYDINQTADSQLANISTRGFVLTGNNVMIGGFILGGNNATRVIVRGIGPSLAQFGLNPVLADPILELHDNNGATLVSNDDWQSDTVSAAQLVFFNLAPSDSKESGIFAILPPGQFTAILAGKNGGTGIGLVEIYNVH